MTKQLILSVLFVSYILIIKETKAHISVEFYPPVAQVNKSLCIYLNLTNLINETHHEITFMFKPPTYNEILLFSYSNETLYQNKKVIDSYFNDRLNIKTDARSLCLSNVLKEDLAYPFIWKYNDDEINFHLHDSSEEAQAPIINAIFFEPVIPVFGKPMCYSLNYSIDEYTLVDNVILSSKFHKYSEWVEIFRIFEGKLKFNNESQFYNKLDTKNTYADYVCFHNNTLADNLYNFNWTVYDLNSKNTTQIFNSDYNGKLDGHTKFNHIKLAPTYPKENESFCINFDYKLNYNGNTNSISVFNLKINGEIFIYLRNNSFAYALMFTNKLFAESVDRKKTTLTHLCFHNPVDKQMSVELSWFIQDWAKTTIEKIFYLPGFSSNNTFSVMEQYNNNFNEGSQHLCLSVGFVLPYQSELLEISLYSHWPRQPWEQVLNYFTYDDEASYKQTDNIDSESKRSNGFCFTEVTADVIYKQYKWRIIILKSINVDLATKEFSLKSVNWNIELPKILQIETIPSVPVTNQELCFYLKYTIDSHTSLQNVTFGTVSLYDINHQEIPNSYEQIFHLSEDFIQYNGNHALVSEAQVEYHRSDYDQICFTSVETDQYTYKSFKWSIKDSYNQVTESIYSLQNSISNDLSHNITGILYDPPVAEADKPLCITLEYTGEKNKTSLHLYVSYPGAWGSSTPKLIYSYFYEYDNVSFCTSEVLDICEHINHNASTKNKVCFNKLTNADSYRTFVWSIENKNGFFNYQFSFDVFDYPTITPNLTLKSQQFDYKAGDRIYAKCSFENVTVNPRLSWYINNEPYRGEDAHYFYSNYTRSNPNWHVSLHSDLNLEITNDMVIEGKNILLTCQGTMGHKGGDNEEEYKVYKSNRLIPVKGAQNNNETEVNSLTFRPILYKRSQPVCLSVNYTTAAEVLNLYLVQGKGDTSKVIYEYENGKISFPDSVNLTSRIDLENTNNSTFCLLNVEKVDEQEYYWVIDDNERNHVKQAFELVTYEEPEQFNFQVFNIKEIYNPEDIVEGHCFIKNIRPLPQIQLQLDGIYFPSNWSINMTSKKNDNYNSVVLFAFEITPELKKKNMSVISCQYSLRDMVKDSKQVNLYFHNKDNPKKGASAGTIAGAIIGTIIAVILIGGVGYYFYKKKYQMPERQKLIQNI